MVKVVLIEGMDRAGKDTLASSLHDRENKVISVTYNAIPYLQKQFYDVSRMMFKHRNISFVSRVGMAMAVHELLQLLANIERLRDTNYDTVVVSRSFISTAVYDSLRGVHDQYIADFYEEILDIVNYFEYKSGIKMDMRLIKLYVDKTVMIDRGSKRDSFEVENYDEIKRRFDDVSSFITFENEMTIDTSNVDAEEVYQAARTFLFT